MAGHSQSAKAENSEDKLFPGNAYENSLHNTSPPRVMMGCPIPENIYKLNSSKVGNATNMVK